MAGPPPRPCGGWTRRSGRRGGRRVGALTCEVEVGVFDRVSVPRTWFKSSYSGETSLCVEASFGERQVLVRDSNSKKNAVLAFRHAAWCGFLAGLVDPGAGGS
ncbi:DUF397 domain-containing protein [Streptomyces adelaidensis]|uniref:DUF397 domain-containing protein n=1 Tax=Streptomyces adelaidensis TaxID=2796465 RepID=UPI0027DD67B4|nr:DUF397 domain-containing protein [Streptomyces adelaidensis]